MFFPILSNLSAILAMQHNKGGGEDPESSAKWDWGWRYHPITGKKQWHNGVDLPAPEGTPIYCPLDGVVEKVAHSELSGNYLRITHRSSEFPEIDQTRYAHLSGYGPGIYEGAIVTQGQVIGYVGSTGRSTGPHLHFMVVNHQPSVVDGMTRRDTNPLPYLENKKKLQGMAIVSTMLFASGLLYWWFSKH